MHAGKVIKILRKNKNMTKDQLSEALGGEQKQYTEIWIRGRPQSENGNNTETVHTIRRAAVGVCFPRAFEKWKWFDQLSKYQRKRGFCPCIKCIRRKKSAGICAWSDKFGQLSPITEHIGTHRNRWKRPCVPLETRINTGFSGTRNTWNS